MPRTIMTVAKMAAVTLPLPGFFGALGLGGCFGGLDLAGFSGAFGVGISGSCWAGRTTSMTGAGLGSSMVSIVSLM